MASFMIPYASFAFLLVFGLVKWLSWMRETSAVRSLEKRLPTVGLDEANPKQAWFTHGRALVERGLREIRGPFLIPTSTGPKVVIRHEHTEEFTRSRHISGVETLRVDSFADYPGFEAAQVAVESSLLRNTLARRLTKSLDTIKDDIAQEIALATQEIFGDCDEWTTRTIQTDVSDLAARLVSRTMVGKPLCYNQQWNQATADYTRLVFGAASALRQVHPLLRPFRHWSLEPCVQLRETARKARKLIADELERRDMATSEASKEVEGRSDGLHWLLEEIHSSKTVADVAAAELHLSLIGCQTTSHSLGQALRLLCEHPEWLLILRQEVKVAVESHGWTKKGLSEMPYLDSFLKEAQRITTGYLAMNSIVTEDITLADGMKLPKSTRCVLESRFLHSEIYPLPHQFDPSRFMHKGDDKPEKQIGGPDTSSFVSTSVDHIGFGYALRSCPGRFLAADMMKISFGFLVLNYDWDFVPDDKQQRMMEIESIQLLHPEAKMWMKRAA